jgi:RNA polymerase sigma factor (sigma-70 family)
MRGDEADLYRSLSPRVLRLVRAQVRTSTENIEDACHFAWVAFLRRSDDVAREGALTWLTRTAIHETYKLIAREQRAASLDQALEVGFDPAADSESSEPVDRAQQREQLALVRQLPDRQQRIVLLQAAGLSHGEIARVTGDTERTVQRQLYRARNTLAGLEWAEPAQRRAARVIRPPPTRGATVPKRTL